MEKINIDAFQKAILQYRNTPDPITKLSPAMCVFGRHTKDLIPILPGKYDPHQTWRECLNLREKALRYYHMTHQEIWNEYTKSLTPLRVGCRVRIQNQLVPIHTNGTEQALSSKVHQFHQCLIRVYGSGRQIIRNRKFLRKYIPVYQPAKRRSILEDFANLPPPSPSDDTTTSPKPHSNLPPTTPLPDDTTTPPQSPTISPPTPLHTPKKNTKPPSTPTRTGIEINTTPPPGV